MTAGMGSAGKEAVGSGSPGLPSVGGWGGDRIETAHHAAGFKILDHWPRAGRPTMGACPAPETAGAMGSSSAGLGMSVDHRSEPPLIDRESTDVAIRASSSTYFRARR